MHIQQINQSFNQPINQDIFSYFRPSRWCGISLLTIIIIRLIIVLKSNWGSKFSRSRAAFLITTIFTTFTSTFSSWSTASTFSRTSWTRRASELDWFRCYDILIRKKKLIIKLNKLAKWHIWLQMSTLDFFFSSFLLSLSFFFLSNSFLLLHILLSTPIPDEKIPSCWTYSFFALFLLSSKFTSELASEVVLVFVLVLAGAAGVSSTGLAFGTYFCSLQHEKYSMK